MIKFTPLKLAITFFAVISSLSLSGCGGSSSSKETAINTLPDCTTGASDFSGCWASSCSAENINGVDLSSLLVIRYKETKSSAPTSGEKNTFGVQYKNASCSGVPNLVINVFTDSVVRNYSANDKVTCFATGGTQLSGDCEKIDIDHLNKGVKVDLLSATSVFHVNNKNTLCLPLDKTTDDESSEAEFIDLTQASCYNKFTF